MSTEESIFSQLKPNDVSAFQELIHIGYLTHTFEWLDHEFTLRTLTIDEELAIGQIIKHYDGTVTQEKALVTAVMAGSLLAIDGQPPFGGEIIKDPIKNLRERYRVISEKWHWPVIAKLNEEYLELQKDVFEHIAEIENLSQEGRAKSLENSTDLSDLSKEHPFLTGEDPTDFS